MMRDIEVEGTRWRVRPLPQQIERIENDNWNLARVRFDPIDHPAYPSRETWLRLEEDVPADDVLDQYEDEELVEAFLVAEEIEEE